MASFKEAFAAARKAGKKEFTWEGKKYNTKLKEETSSAPKTSPRPKAKPSVTEKAVKAIGRAEAGSAKRFAPAKAATAPAKSKEWKEMSRKERKAAGEPVSALGKGLKNFKERMKSGGYSTPAKK